MLSGAKALVAEAEDELRTIAALLDVPCYLVDSETGELTEDTAGLSTLVREAFPGTAFEDPFTGEPMDVFEALELCGFWRRLIDSNRDLVGGVGFAFWKQDHVAPLLWGGSTPFHFLRGIRDVRTDGPIAVWRAKTPAELLTSIETRKARLVEVEDGFLRSRGLGADCIPPLSITVDRSGAYFDPSQPSDLEKLLETGQFDEASLQRASQLRVLIVESGIGKYERGLSIIKRPAAERRHILVPGQVEDDRAVVTGGCGLVKNIDLLAKVREQAPDAFILYKPHPDVLAGHRRGDISERECLRFADQVVSEGSIASLIAMVDEVHVNTSLAGFEALLRDKPVTTYGVPFYAGWGLTTDLGPVPPRRTSKRSIDELAAAVLLVYPRYLDPQTGLPCPAEIVVSRLGATEAHHPGLIVGLRRLQGRFVRRLRSLVQ
jgi:capsular polysaccharide export protein